MLRPLLTTLSALLRSRSDLLFENLALRQQLAVLQNRQPRRRMPASGRLFWMALRQLWPKWRQVLVLVKPETVVRWHRLGFRAFWRWRSRARRPGRPKVGRELRALIQRMARENLWGAPRIHAELKLLGFDVAERTISRYLKRAPGPDAVERWKALLRLHRNDLVAMDFFTVPTLSFQVLYVLVLLHHHRRRVVHFAVTALPTGDWIRQQLREAFPYDTAPRFLILDRDGLFDASVLHSIRALAVTPVRTAPRSPWQNGVLERWIGSVRRELLDHVVVSTSAISIDCWPSTSPTTMRTARIWRWARTHRQGGRWSDRRRPMPRSSLSRASAGCTTATRGETRPELPASPQSPSSPNESPEK